MYRRSYQRRQYANGNVQRVRSKGKKSQRAYWKDIRWKEKKVDRNEWTEGAGTLLLAGDINTFLTGSKGRHILRRPHIFDGRDFLRVTEVTHGLETAELWY
jgi:hypothetical protein